MYKALDIAKYVIWYCNHKHLGISNLKLQKMLYFIQAEFLVELDYPCFEDQIQAWDFGPVVPSVYHEYKIFGNSNIPYMSSDIPRIGLLLFEEKHIKEIVAECSKYSASQLVDMTHRQTPWIEAYKKRENNEITNSEIKDFFTD